MRRIFVAMIGLMVLGASSASAQVQVDGYWRKDGTYVEPHYRSSPDGNTLNNYSTKGNTNPYTGEQGTVDPYDSPKSYGSQDYKIQGWGIKGY